MPDRARFKIQYQDRSTEEVFTILYIADDPKLEARVEHTADFMVRLNAVFEAMDVDLLTFERLETVSVEMGRAKRRLVDHLEGQAPPAHESSPDHVH